MPKHSRSSLLLFLHFPAKNEIVALLSSLNKNFEIISLDFNEDCIHVEGLDGIGISFVSLDIFPEALVAYDLEKDLNIKLSTTDLNCALHGYGGALEIMIKCSAPDSLNVNCLDKRMMWTVPLRTLHMEKLDAGIIPCISSCSFHAIKPVLLSVRGFIEGSSNDNLVICTKAQGLWTLAIGETVILQITIDAVQETAELVDTETRLAAKKFMQILELFRSVGSDTKCNINILRKVENPSNLLMINAEVKGAVMKVYLASRFG